MHIPRDSIKPTHPGLSHTDSVPAIIRHGNDPKSRFLNHVAMAMETLDTPPIWTDLFSAMFSSLNISSCHIENYLCTLRIDAAVWSQAKGDDRKVHFPQEWVIRLVPGLNRIEFVDNSCEAPTGIIGSKKVFMLGLCKGAVQWISFDADGQELVTFTKTNVSIKKTDLHRSSYSEAVADWKERIWIVED